MKLTSAGVAGQYVGPWFVGSVCEASSERRVPSGISGSPVREMCSAASSRLSDFVRSTKKVMQTVFCDMKGPMTIDFLEKGTTVNSASYCQFLKENSPYLLNNLHSFMHTNSNRQIHIYILTNYNRYKNITIYRYM